MIDEEIVYQIYETKTKQSITNLTFDFEDRGKGDTFGYKFTKVLKKEYEIAIIAIKNLIKNLSKNNYAISWCGIKQLHKGFEYLIDEIKYLFNNRIDFKIIEEIIDEGWDQLGSIIFFFDSIRVDTNIRYNNDGSIYLDLINCPWLDKEKWTIKIKLINTIIKEINKKSILKKIQKK